MASTHLVKPRITTTFTSTLPHRNLFITPHHPLPTIASGIQQRQHPALSIDRTRQFHAGARRPHLSPPTKKVLMSASFFSFLGSLFSSSTSAENNMTYPDQRTDEEWRAVLSPGIYDLSRTWRKKSMLTELAFIRTIPNHPSKRHRTPRLRQIRFTLPLHRRLQLRCLRCTALQGRHQIQIRLWLACIFRFCARGGYATCRSDVWHGAD